MKERVTESALHDTSKAAAAPLLRLVEAAECRDGLRNQDIDKTVRIIWAMIHGLVVLLFNCIENSIRKLSRHAPPNVITNWRITIRRFSDSINCILDRIDECLCHLNSLLCIVFDCLRVLNKSFWVKHISHGSTNRRTCANASSPGITCTEPSLTSSLRLVASVTQTA
jgi:hypothetical protein